MSKDDLLIDNTQKQLLLHLEKVPNGDVIHLKELLESEHESVRLAALVLLSRCEKVPKELIPYIKNLLYDEFSHVRLIAGQLLLQFGISEQKDFISCLRELLKSGHESVTLRALELLLEYEECTPKELVPYLEKLLNNKNSYAKLEALMPQFGEIPEEFIRKLFDLLKSNCLEVREEAENCLILLQKKAYTSQLNPVFSNLEKLLREEYKEAKSLVPAINLTNNDNSHLNRLLIDLEIEQNKSRKPLLNILREICRIYDSEEEPQQRQQLIQIVLLVLANETKPRFIRIFRNILEGLFFSTGQEIDSSSIISSLKKIITSRTFLYGEDKRFQDTLKLFQDNSE